ncbi:hypothetical protein PPERSA_01663 [Pseudocohnilembus persalinus]|uniref:Arginine--tRNA ligase n=1 Tax=Pseudocohnilembus persalinus TaxID=266149 RepID=A0A0V0R0P1_PSEPJ|nr:hypothetical protein PPERSA_01663 [Pseudocohnilembus persalinus]|eukprot:KRX08118.1 hypothetical protein PPERSA_01663 [Pseudocohnilembus persalinus]
MKSLSKSLQILLQNSKKQAFNFPIQDSENIEVNITASDSKYDYSTKFPLEIYKQNDEQMTKYWGPHKILPNQIGQELLQQIDRKNGIIENTTVEGSGQIYFRIKDKAIIENLQILASAGLHSNLFDLQDGNLENKYGIFFPPGEINNKLHLNTLRSLNRVESIARMLELSGKSVQRFSVLDNYSTFHGIILGFLYKQYYEKPKNERKQNPSEIPEKPSEKELQNILNMENLANFMVQENLDTEEKIKEYAQKQLIDLDMDKITLHKQLSQTSEINIMQIFTYFLAIQKNVKVLNLKELSHDYRETIENQIKLISNNQQKQKQNIQIIKLQNNKIALKFGENLENQVIIFEEQYNLSEIGKILAVLENLSSKNYTNLIFSSDFQDQFIFKMAQQILPNLNKNISLEYIGIGNLFYENDEKIKLNYYEQFLEQLGLTSIQKMKEKFPTVLPGLLEEKQDAFTSQALGWTRYLDHKKDSKVSYLLKSEDIIDYMLKNDEITNMRLELHEILQTYLMNMQDMKFEENSQRNFNINSNIQKMGEKFRFQDYQERQLARILINLSDQVQTALQNKNLKNLSQYIFILFEIYKEMKNTNYITTYRNDMSQQEVINRIILLKSFINNLSSTYYFLGILNNKQYI